MTNCVIEVEVKEFVDGKITDLRDIVDIRFNELAHRMDSQSDVNHIAIQKAEDGLNARLAAMNEFRGAMTDLSSTFSTRSDYDVHYVLGSRFLISDLVSIPKTAIFVSSKTSLIPPITDSALRWLLLFRFCWHLLSI